MKFSHLYDIIDGYMFYYVSVFMHVKFMNLLCKNA